MKNKVKESIQSPPRDLLERFYAEKIASLKQSLDEVFEPGANEKDERLTQLQSLQAYHNICLAETNEIIDLFGKVTDATLHPNHRKVMKITKHYNNLLKEMPIISEENENSPQCMDFARLSIDYLTSFHKLLINDKKWTHKLKKEVMDVFLEWEKPNYDR